MRIFDQEQEASRSVGEAVCTVPRRARVGAERVARGGAHDDERGPLPPQSRAPLQSVQKRANTPGCRSAGGTKRRCGRPCSTCTAGGSSCRAACPSTAPQTAAPCSRLPRAAAARCPIGLPWQRRRLRALPQPWPPRPPGQRLPPPPARAPQLQQAQRQPGTRPLMRGGWQLWRGQAHSPPLLQRQSPSLPHQATRQRRPPAPPAPPASARWRPAQPSAAAAHRTC